MVSRPTACDRVRLGELLEARLSDAEQAELSGHLERCEVCRRELESMAAESQWWHDVRKLADTEGFGPAETAALGHDEPSLAFLAPSQDADHLGRLGAYEVTSIIGRGGMSIVLKAFDPGLSRVVAIKVLAPQLATSAAARRRFAREARAAAAVSHDHVVPIHAVDSANGFPYLVMPFLPGRSLQDRIDRDGPLAVEEILRIGMQTAAGLAAAHQQGLVHRDIKPANILLEHGVERVKITDFGLARAIDDASATQSGVVAGTPQYMAPEQTRGGAIDHRADLFSLGSVMYAMATGHSPFRAETTMAVLRRVSDAQPRPIRDINPQIPEWLAAIIAKLHEKEPEDRFQTAAEVADLLGRCLAFVQQPSVVALPRVPRLRRSESRAPHWGTAAIAIVLVAGLGTTEATGITGLLSSVAAVFRTDSDTGNTGKPSPDPHIAAHSTGTAVALNEGDNRDLRRVAWDSAEAQSPAMTADDNQHRYSLSLMRKPDSASNDVVETPDELEAARQESKRVSSDALEIAVNDLVAGARNDRLPLDDPPHIPDRPQTRAIAVRAQIEALRFEINAYQQVLDDAEKAGVVAALRNRLERLEKQLVEIAGTALEQPLPIVVPDVLLREVRVLQADRGVVSATALSRDGNHVLSGGSDHSVKLWDASNGQLIRELRGHTGDVLCVAFHPNGRSAISGGADRAIRIWDLETGVEQRKLEGLRGRAESLAVTPDGQFVLAGDGVADPDKTSAAPGSHVVHVWNFNCGTEVRTFRGHTAGIHTVAVSSDGHRALSAGDDDSARLWNVETGAELAQADVASSVLGALFVADDSRAALCCEGIRVWNFDRPDEASLFNSPRSSRSPTTVMVPVRGGRNVISASRQGGPLCAWDVATARQLTIKGSPKHLAVTSLAVSPDGRVLIVAAGGELRFYELELDPFNQPSNRPAEM